MSPAELSAALADGRRPTTVCRRRRGWPPSSAAAATPSSSPPPTAALRRWPPRSTARCAPLRFAALDAVMQLSPPQTFPGASCVPEALWYFAAGAGDPAAVAAAPVFTRASDWAGQLRGLGYEATPAGTGRAALVAAARSAPRRRGWRSSCSTATSASRSLREVVFQLRSATARPACRSSSRPAPRAWPQAQRIAADDPLRPRRAAPAWRRGAADAGRASASRSPRRLAGRRDARTAQAAQALEWIAKLLAADAPYDELRRDAALVNRTLFVPELAEPVAPRARGARHGREPSGAGRLRQLALAADRSAAAAPPTLSPPASSSSASSSPASKILGQYDRYNASETADADTQQVLGGILDAIEKKK